MLPFLGEITETTSITLKKQPSTIESKKWQEYTSVSRNLQNYSQ